MMSAVFPWLLMLWAKASILLILALVADRVLRGAPARARHALWTGTFIALLALPILSGMLPELPVPSLGLLPAAAVEAPRMPAGSPVGTGSPVEVEALTPTAVLVAQTDQGADFGAAEAARPSEDVAAISPTRDYGAVVADRLVAAAPTSVVGLWAFGAAIALSLLLISFRRASRLVARAGEVLDVAWRTDLREARAMLGMRDTVRLRASSLIGTPMAGGLWRRVVLVPDLACTWSAERRRFVLLHELVHLARRDPVRHLIARLALVLHWPNPLAWLAAHRAMAAREEACDEQVLSLGAKPSSYARELMELNELLRSPSLTRIAVLPMIQHSRMEKRVMNILRDNRRPLRRPVAIALVAAASIATLSVAAAAPQEPQKPKPVVKVRVAPQVAVKSVIKLEPQITVVPAVVRLDPEVKIVARPVVSVVPEIQLAPSQIMVNVAPQIALAVVPSRVVGIAVAPSVAMAQTPAFSGVAFESACTPERSGTFDGSRWITTDGDDGEDSVYQQIGIQNGDFIFIKRFDDQMVCMRTDGDVEVDRETGAITSIGSDGLVVWEAHDGGTVQRLEVRAGDDYTWSINGDKRAFDADARAWYDAMREVVVGHWKIVHIRGQVSSLRGQISSIRGQRSSSRGQISSARGQVSSMRGQISSIRGQRSSLRGQISSIRGQVSSMRGQISSERGSISSLRGQRRRAEDDQLRKIDERIERHNMRIREIEEQLEAFGVEARMAEVEAQIEALRTDDRIAETEALIESYDLDARTAEILRHMEALEVDANTVRIEAQIEAMNASERIEELEASLEPALERLQRLIARMR